MASRASLAAWGLTIGAAAAFLLLAPGAAAAPAPLQYNPGEIFNDTYSDFSSALNITGNVSEKMMFFLDCGVALDWDYLYIWQSAGQDLSIWIETEQALNFRFPATLKDPGHFNIVETELRPQVGRNATWLNTTTWLEGPYILALGGPGCATPAEFYNLTWSSAPTSAVNDGDNDPSTARVITDGLSVVSSLTETFDQQDFFRVDASFTPPSYQYLLITSAFDLVPASVDVEFYNASGLVAEDPQWIPSFDPNSTVYSLASIGYPFPGDGSFYLRLWSHGLDANYSIDFSVALYTPAPNIDYNNATQMTDNFRDANSSLQYAFENGHFYKIFISSPRTIWGDARSNLIDIQLQLLNTTPSGSHLQQRLSRHVFDSNANPKDHEFFTYTVTASQLAASTGWYYVVVRMDSDIPPSGLYTLDLWLNDAPAGSTQTQTLDEDVPLVGFNVGGLFTDLDCTLDALDPDCALAMRMWDAAPGNVTFDFAGGLLNATPAADWSGTECRLFNATDAKGLNATATLCVTFVSRNDPPIVVPSAPSRRNMTEDTALNAVLVGLWFLDVDAGDSLNLSFAGNDNLSATLDSASGLGNFVPEANFNGCNNLTFTADDGQSNVTHIVEFCVFPANDAPEARGSLPFVTVAEDGTVTLNLNAVDIGGVVGPAFTDIDGNALTYGIVNTEPLLLVTVSGPIVTIRPAPNISDRFFFFEIEASDGLAVSPRASVRVDVTPVNDPPQIDVATPSPPVSVAEGASQAFSVTASDPDGETPRYQWFLDGVGQSGATAASFTLATQVTDALARSVVVRVNVSDAQGTWVDHEWTLAITNTNQGPRVTITAPTALSFASDADISFSATATDPDGDALTWTWTSDRVGLPIGSAQTVTAKLPVGSNLITVDVFDGQAHATATITITVTPATSGVTEGPNMVLIGGAVGVIAAGAAAAFVISKRRKA